MSAQFNIRRASSRMVSVLQRELDLPRFVAATLVGRGIDTPKAARAFLFPSFKHDWLDPYLIPGLGDVVDALEDAVRKGRRILVFGDFDLDGISATTVLTRGLRELGADTVPFIPKRFEEGYGITAAALERAKTYGPDFLVTVDCGIACKAEVKLVQAAGIDVAITDHHEPTDLVPEGVPVADPKIDATCPSCVLAGAGVALKLVQALGARFGKPYLWRDFVDFATLGTVADLMPMLGENRRIRLDDAGALCAWGETVFCASGWGDVIWRLDAERMIPTGLFAGGELADEDLDEMMKGIQEAYWIAKEKNKKYTPKKYRK